MVKIIFIFFKYFIKWVKNCDKSKKIDENWKNIKFCRIIFNIKMKINIIRCKIVRKKFCKLKIICKKKLVYMLVIKYKIF